MGAGAYPILAQFDDFGEGECVLEIGSERGEGSTKWLASFCAQRKIIFHTVDIDPKIHAKTQELLRRYKGCFAHCERGEDFLTNGFNGSIRFAYLDGHDCIPVGYEKEEFVAFYKRRYKELGFILNNPLSEASHLIQAALVDIRSASRCAILIDDTNKMRRRWRGKGALAVPYLESRGFQADDLDGAALMVRP